MWRSVGDSGGVNFWKLRNGYSLCGVGFSPSTTKICPFHPVYYGGSPCFGAANAQFCANVTILNETKKESSLNSFILRKTSGLSVFVYYVTKHNKHPHVHLLTCMHTYTCTHVYVIVHTYILTRAFTYVHTHTYKYTYILACSLEKWPKVLPIPTKHVKWFLAICYD